MCFPSAPVAQVVPPPAPVPPPPPPAPVTVSAPPSLPQMPPEKNPQKRAKTAAQKRRAASGFKSGKAKYTIPLGGGSTGSVNV